jgi:molybdopterin/thiamine biosynthesis adenylyltransferase
MGSSVPQLRVTLTLPQHLAEALETAAHGSLETACVLIATIVNTDAQNMRLLGVEVHWVPDSAYQRREVDGLSISSEGYVYALRRAEQLNGVAIWTHTHPGDTAIPLPSNHDIHVDMELGSLFRLRSGCSYYGALIISPRIEGFTFSGHLSDEQGSIISFSRVWIVGDRFQNIRAFDCSSVTPHTIYDRSIRALGGSIQQLLGELHVGIVGCGGTGSSVAEQLVRLGVRHLLLCDPKQLSESNITRVYGSTPKDVTQPKATVLARYLRSIAPESQLEPIQSMITMEKTAKRFASCDLIFGCTDDNAGRLVLSRIATYLLIPVIDCGILLTSDENDHLIGIDGRVTILYPGQACLVCRGRVDLSRAGAELLTPEERIRRENEGYAPALGMIEPAVVTYTTLVAATAVSELLERLIGYGPTPRPSEILLRCHEREVSTNQASSREFHYCHKDAGKTGLGITSPFLEQTWQA